MIISLFTATWHYNLWDELILKQEYKFLIKRFGTDNRFNIFTYDENSTLLSKNENINYISYFPKNIRKNPFLNLKYLFKNMRAILSSDMIIIGWGWLIYANEIQSASSPIWQWKMRIFFAKLFKKKIIWLAVWISYPQKRIKELRYLFFWKRTFVSVRDKNSQELLKKINISSTLLSDPVFMSEKNNKTERNKPTIWISIRKGYLLNELENIKQIVLYLSRKWYNLIFLSHSIHKEDILANDMAFLKEFAVSYRIPITENLSETLDAYSKVDIVIWMRFHSMILSIINDIPFLALSYWQKTQELLSDFEYKFVLNPKKFDFEEFIHNFEDLEKINNEAKFALKAKYDRISKNISLDYNKFFDGF